MSKCIEKQEFGGFLPIDSRNQEYYDDGRGYSIKRLNAARYAIALAVLELKCTHVWIPTYCCKTIADTLDKYKIQYTFYRIDDSFLPCVDRMSDNECILAINYFGYFGADYYDIISSKYNKIIFDNTQSFFSAPVLKNNTINVYSPRKFLGVVDGAYMISKDNISNFDIALDYSFQRSSLLFSSFELGTNEIYNEYLKDEDYLSKADAKEMSRLTRCLLGNIDYEYVKKKRINNFNLLAKALANTNELNFETIGDDNKVPMVYPYLVTDSHEQYRKYLVSNRIYVPQWWKWVLSQQQASEFEIKLSKCLFPLPIDQRYSDSDMHKVARIVKEGLKI